MTPLEYYQKNRARMLEELKELLSIPSVSALPEHKADVRKCAEWLTNHCKQLGLKAKLNPTAGNPIVTAHTEIDPNLPTYLVYGHYDVQPVDPLDKWKTEPFKPVIKDGNIYGRGTTDDKGQFFMHLKAYECLVKSGNKLPCNLTFIFEGEEEIGSENFPQFLRDYADELKCEAVVVSDTGMPSLQLPALTYALRGLASLEVFLTGPDRDLHSGVHGGAVMNPIHALCSLIAGLHDSKGRVTVAGFYDDVRELENSEREEFKRLPYSDSTYKAEAGNVPDLFGEEGFTSYERRTARPTLEVNGITGGYQGEGDKTIIPSTASAKITCRLVAHQKPEKILDLVAEHLVKNCPSSVTIKVEKRHGGEPYELPANHPKMKAALSAMEKAFGCKPTIIRGGGSIPITMDFKKYLGADTLLVGLSLPDDNEHSPNEKYALECFDKGVTMGTYIWDELTVK